MIEFYKARVQYFYSGMVNQIDFANVEEEIKSAINNQVSMKTEGKVEEIFHHEHPMPDPPMTFFAANFFQVSTIVSLTVARNWKAPSYRNGSVCKWPTPSQAIKDRVFARRTLSKSKKYRKQKLSSCDSFNRNVFNTNTTFELCAIWCMVTPLNMAFLLCCFTFSWNSFRHTIDRSSSNLFSLLCWILSMKTSSKAHP